MVIILVKVDARTETQDISESVPKLGVHPAIDHGVVAAVAHGEPVTADPHHLDVSKCPDLIVGVSHQGDSVQGQPAEGVDNHNRDHHLHHLKSTYYENNFRNTIKINHLAFLYYRITDDIGMHVLLYTCITQNIILVFMQYLVLHGVLMPTTHIFLTSKD